MCVKCLGGLGVGSCLQSPCKSLRTREPCPGQRPVVTVSGYVAPRREGVPAWLRATAQPWSPHSRGGRPRFPGRNWLWSGGSGPLGPRQSAGALVGCSPRMGTQEARRDQQHPTLLLDSSQGGSQGLRAPGITAPGLCPQWFCVCPRCLVWLKCRQGPGQLRAGPPPQPPQKERAGVTPPVNLG